MRPCESCFSAAVVRFLEVRHPDGAAELQLLCELCFDAEVLELQVGDVADSGPVDVLGEPLVICPN